MCKNLLHQAFINHSSIDWQILNAFLFDIEESISKDCYVNSEEKTLFAVDILTVNDHGGRLIVGLCNNCIRIIPF